MKRFCYRALGKLAHLRARIAVAVRLLPSILQGRRHLLITKSHTPSDWPRPCPGPRIHFGCGRVDAPGWINIDAHRFDHVSYQSTDIHLTAFVEGSIEEIYLCHVLEHFSFKEVAELLGCYYSKLAKNGKLRISVPDFDSLMQIYLESSNSIEIIAESLMGGQDDQYNYHKSIFNESYLSELLVKAGFASPQIWQPQDFMEASQLLIPDWSSYKFPTSKGFRPISLNIVAYKPVQ